MQRGSGREHVVDDQHLLSRDPARFRQLERTAQVHTPRLGPETALGRGCTRADEHAIGEWHAALARDGLCETRGLVVATLAAARGVQRHGDDHAGPRRLRERPGDRRGEHVREPGPRIELERVHQGGDTVVIEPRGVHELVGVTAAAIGRTLLEQAAGAQRRAERGQSPPARLAQQARGRRGRATARAALRQDELEQFVRDARERVRYVRDPGSAGLGLGGGGAPQRGHPTAAASGASGTSRPNHTDSECRAWCTSSPRPSTASKPRARAAAIHGVNSSP